MSEEIYVAYLDWEKFQQFRDIDFNNFDEEAQDEYFEKVSAGEGKVEDIYWPHRNDLERGLDQLKALFFWPRDPLVELDRLFWTARSRIIKLRTGKATRVFWKDGKEIIEGLEFAMQRLLPFHFNAPSYCYQDSDIDFSALREPILNTLSPHTVRAVVASFPPPLVPTYPELGRYVIPCLEQYSEDRATTRLHNDGFVRIDEILSELRKIVERAAAKGQGLCIYRF